MENPVLACLSALAHPQRLALLGLLMRRHPDRLPAGEIGRLMATAPSTLSGWLSDLAEAGLIEAERRGTSLLYRARPEAVQAAIAAFLAGTCRHRADPPSPPRPGPVLNLLFLGRGNAARTLMAEAILRSRAGRRFEVFSAGVEPAGAADPRALAMLAELGHDTAALWVKPAAEFLAPGAARMDIVLTLDDQVANGDLPDWPGQPLQAHWGLPDPTGPGTAEGFAECYLTLAARIDRLAALPSAMSRPELQRALDDLAALGIPAES